MRGPANPLSKKALLFLIKVSSKPLGKRVYCFCAGDPRAKAPIARKRLIFWAEPAIMNGLVKG